MIRYLYRNPL